MPILNDALAVWGEGLGGEERRGGRWSSSHKRPLSELCGFAAEVEQAEGVEQAEEVRLASGARRLSSARLEPVVWAQGLGRRMMLAARRTPEQNRDAG